MPDELAKMNGEMEWKMTTSFVIGWGLVLAAPLVGYLVHVVVNRDV